MNTSNQTSFNLDTLLDGTLDDLADLPEFKPFPAGTHRAIIKMEQKVVNNHPSIEVSLKAVETIELANTDDEPLVAGAETSVLYMLDNEIAQGAFKKVLASLGEHFGAMSNRELIATAQNAEVLVVTKLRSNKDKSQMYTDIVALQVA